MRLLHIQFVLIILFSAMGCKQKVYPPEESVTLALPQFPKSLDPRFTTDATGQRINHLLFNSLVRVGPNMDVISDAATSWSLKELTYTFKIVKDLTFSDGKRVTNEDIKYTFNEYKKDSSPFKGAFDIIDKVEPHLDIVDPEIKITLKKFNANFLLDLSLARILSSTNTNPNVGTGAFELISQNLNEIVLQKREHPIYKPKIKYIVFKIIQDDATRFLNAYKGAIDIIQYGLPPNKISYIKERGRYNIFSYPGPSMNYILLNLKNKKFDNPEVRKALSMAIDRESIINYKLEGYATAATSLLPKNNLFHNKEIPAIPFKPDDSRKILEKYNLIGTEIELKTSNNPEVVEFAKVVATQLDNIGLKIKLQSYEWGTFYGDISSGNYEMAIMRWVGLSDPDIYRTAFHSKEFPPGRNRGFYSNKKIDGLLDQGIEIQDKTKRIEHYNNIQSILFNEHIIIPLWYNTLVDVVHKRINNYIPPANGDLSPLYEIEISKITD